MALREIRSPIFNVDFFEASEVFKQIKESLEGKTATEKLDYVIDEIIRRMAEKEPQKFSAIIDFIRRQTSSVYRPVIIRRIKERTDIDQSIRNELIEKIGSSF